MKCAMVQVKVGGFTKDPKYLIASFYADLQWL